MKQLSPEELKNFENILLYLKDSFTKELKQLKKCSELHYEPRYRGHPDIQDKIEHQSIHLVSNLIVERRECYFCSRFTHTQKQYQQEKGTCSILSEVSEWGICNKFELGENLKERVYTFVETEKRNRYFMDNSV